MATIDRNLQRLVELKGALQQSIINKGVNVPDSATMYDYDSYVNQIQTATTPTLQHKTYEISKNGTTVIAPDFGFDGISGGAIVVDVPSAPKLQTKIATENGLVQPDADYDGLSSVYVNVETGSTAKLETKDFTITQNGETQIVPSAGFDGISGGTISVNVASKLQKKDFTITENGKTNIYPPAGYDGISGGSITVNVPPPALQTRTVNITKNGTFTINPTGDFYGMDSAVIVVNVTGSTENAVVKVHLTPANIAATLTIHYAGQTQTATNDDESGIVSFNIFSGVDYRVEFSDVEGYYTPDEITGHIDYAERQEHDVEYLPKEVDYYVITYTTTDGNIIVPSPLYEYGETPISVLSNTYEDGVGRMTIAKDLTTLYAAFHHKETLETIDLSNIQFKQDIVNTGMLFVGCVNLKSIVFPNTGPATKYFSAGAMCASCSSLETMTFVSMWDAGANYKGVSFLGNAFEGIKENGIIYYPAGANYKGTLSTKALVDAGWTGQEI